MKKMNLRKMMALFLAAVMFVSVFTFNTATSEAADSSEGPILVFKSACNYYSKAAATDANKLGQSSFGEEVVRLGASGNFTKVKYNGKECYVLTSNLAYKKQTVIKLDILASPTASATSEAKALGHVYYGTEVTVLGEKTASNGTKYIYCKIPKTYDANGKVKKQDVKGYINASYLQESSVPKVINTTTNLYAKASTSSTKTQIYIGEEVDVIQVGSSWSKVKYNGKEYFVLNDKLTDKKLQIMAGQVALLKEPKPSAAKHKDVNWLAEAVVLGVYESPTYGKFYKVKIDGTTGFIREYSNTKIQLIGYAQDRINLGTTQLYKKANTNSGSLTQIPAGSAIKVMYQGTTWCKVKYGTKEGYILTAKLGGSEYVANGEYYTTSKDLYDGANSKGTLVNEKVQLLSSYTGRKFAYVKTQAGKYAFMALGNVTKIEPDMTIVSGSCWSYKEPNGTAESNRHTQMFFGDEVKRIENLGDWSAVQYNGKTMYIRTKELALKKLMVNKQDILVSPIAYTTTEEKCLGHLKYGTEVKILGQKTSSKGTFYLCEIDKTVNKDGSTKKENVIGYINANYLEEKKTTRYAAAQTNLYARATAGATTTKIFAETELEVMDESTNVVKITVNGQKKETTWSKVRYNGKVYYIYTINLTDELIEDSITMYTCFPKLEVYKSPEYNSNNILSNDIGGYMTEVEYISDTKAGDGSGRWIKLRWNDQVCYMWEPKGETRLTETKSTYIYEASTRYEKDVIEYALTFLNKKTAYSKNNDPYYYLNSGTTNPDGAYVFDCIGYASHVINHEMQKYLPAYILTWDINELYNLDCVLNRNMDQDHGYSSDKRLTVRRIDEAIQRNNDGTVNAIDFSLLKAGDIIYFNVQGELLSDGGKPYTHVGVYLGQNADGVGEFIHASSSAGGVSVMPLSKSTTYEYFDKVVTVLRVLPETDDLPPKSFAKRYPIEVENKIFPTNNANSKEIKVVEAGTEITLLYTIHYSGDTWVYVRYDEGATTYEGFMLREKLVSKTSSTYAALFKEEERMAIDTLQLYASRNTSDKSRTLYLGDDVTVIYRGKCGNNSDWHKLEIGDPTNNSFTTHYFLPQNGLDNYLILTNDAATYFDGLFSAAEVKSINGYTQLRSSPENADNIIATNISGRVTVLKAVGTGYWSYVSYASGGTELYGYVPTEKLVD